MKGGVGLPGGETAPKHPLLACPQSQAANAQRAMRSGMSRAPHPKCVVWDTVGLSTNPAAIHHLSGPIPASLGAPLCFFGSCFSLQPCARRHRGACPAVTRSLGSGGRFWCLFSISAGGNNPPFCLLLQKWQRRFFILYEHGLLRYALDEMVSAAPQIRDIAGGGGAPGVWHRDVPVVPWSFVAKPRHCRALRKTRFWCKPAVGACCWQIWCRWGVIRLGVLSPGCPTPPSRPIPRCSLGFGGRESPRLWLGRRQRCPWKVGQLEHLPWEQHPCEKRGWGRREGKKFSRLLQAPSGISPAVPTLGTVGHRGCVEQSESPARVCLFVCSVCWGRSKSRE